MPTFKYGDIVMARVRDPSGVYIDHDHPVIIVTPTQRIVPESAVRVVVISHKITKPLPTGHIPMPWADGGHPVTGLWLECVAKCEWTPQVNHSDIKRLIGYTPPDKMELIYVELAARIRKIKAQKRRQANGSPPEP